MPGRIRSSLQPFPQLSGYAHRSVGGSTTSHIVMTDAERRTYPYEYHFCQDVVNERLTDNPLTIKFEGRQFVPMNGRIDTAPGTYSEFKDHIPDYMKVPLSHATGITSLIPSVGEVATAAIARSNPSKPYISIPNFLYELKDLPEMIRDIGNLKRQLQNTRRKGIQQVTAKNAASHQLSYQMGWEPLISDLRKLVDFQAQLDKKLQELEQLYNGGGIQRRIRSPAWRASKTEQVYTNFPIESTITGSALGDVIRYSTVERWATVRWYPTTLPDMRFSSKQMARLARDLVFGMHAISAKQIWDAIPWTWLIGWFSNVDEYIQAHSNTIPLTHSKPCIMTKTETKTVWIRKDAQLWAKGGYGAAGYSTKERVISSGTLSATLPLLSKRQISILGALAIQRRR